MRMLARLTLALSGVLLFGAAASAQYVTAYSPVVTNYGYGATSSYARTACYPPAPSSCCGGSAPMPVMTANYAPVTTAYYPPAQSSCCGGSAPVTAYYPPAQTSCCGSPAPVTSYYAPQEVVAPVTSYYAPAVTTTSYYAPTTTYYAPSVPVTSYYAPSAVPVTSYYAPAATYRVTPEYIPGQPVRNFFRAVLPPY